MFFSRDLQSNNSLSAFKIIIEQMKSLFYCFTFPTKNKTVFRGFFQYREKGV